LYSLCTGAAVKYCDTCKRRIPDNFLVCPDCLTDRAVAHLEKRQIEILPSVIRGEAALVLVQARGIHRHVQLFGDPYRMYCGESLGSHSKRTRELFTPELVKKLCVPCRIRLAALMEEARAGSVPTDSAATADR